MTAPKGWPNAGGGFALQRIGRSGVYAQLKAENASRVHCKTCGNLVKPALLGQHDRAYHGSGE